MGVVRSDGHVIIEFIAKDIKRLSATRFAVLGDGGYALADTAGNLLTRHVFEQIGHFSQDLAAASVDGRFGYIDAKGRTQIPFIFQVLNGFPDFAKFDDGFAVISLTGTLGIADTAGNVIIGDSFDKVRLLGNGLAMVYESDKGSLLEIKHELFLTDAIYDSSGYFSFGSLPVKTNVLWGAIDSKGQQILYPNYLKVDPAPRGFHIFQSQNGFGIIASDGTEAVQPIYEHASIYSDRFIRLDLSNTSDWFDTFTSKMISFHR